MADTDAERKIYFYRAVPQDGDETFELDRKAVCKVITSLAGTPGFYLDEGSDKITCAEVVDATSPQKIKLYSIRRENLPSRDDGAGTISDLELEDEEGLAEAIHIRLYPDSVIAAEFFYFGPRISRFQTFLNQRCGQEVVLYPFGNGDVIDRALSLKDFRALRIKVHPSAVSQQQAAQLGFDPMMQAAKNLGADTSIDVTFRGEASDGKFRNRVETLLKKVKREDDPEEIFENLEISGKDPVSKHVETINLLSDLLVRVVTIPRESARTRALDSPAAFREIHQAYKDVKDDLKSDALLG
jgi:hypothetical protein